MNPNMTIPSRAAPHRRPHPTPLDGADYLRDTKSNKRPRLDSQSSASRPIDHTAYQSNNQCPLIRLSFVIPLATAFSNDREALRLACSCHQIAYYMKGYEPKSYMRPTAAFKSLSNVALPITITRICDWSACYSDWSGSDVNPFTSLRYLVAGSREVSPDERKSDYRTSCILPYTLPTTITHMAVFRVHIKPGSVPQSVTHLFLAGNQRIDPGHIPPSVTDLRLHNVIDHQLLPGAIPNSVTSIEFNGRYDFPLGVNTLPASLTVLQFGRDSSFDKPLQPGELPASLKRLSMNREYCRPLVDGALPTSLTELEFNDTRHVSTGVYSRGSNHPILTGVLPQSLKRLRLGHRFNQPLTVDVLPSSLNYLEFGLDFNQPLDRGVFPNTLETLILGDFTHALPAGVLPVSLKHLEFLDGVDQTYSGPIFLPPALETFILPRHVAVDAIRPIPSTVTRLHLGRGSTLRSDVYTTIPIGMIPSSVTDLTIGWGIVPGSIPPSVTRLTFEKRYNHFLEVGTIPNSVTHVLVREYFCSELISNLLPESVRHLEFVHRAGYMKSLQMGSIPCALEYLKFYMYSGALPPGLLPSTLKHLDLGIGLHEPLVPGSIPDSVTHLKLDCSDAIWTPNVLPSGLHTLVCSLPPGDIGLIPPSLRQLIILDSSFPLSQQAKPIEGKVTDSTRNGRDRVTCQKSLYWPDLRMSEEERYAWKNKNIAIG